MCRLRAANKAQGDAGRKPRQRDRPRAMPAPEANAELQANLDVCHLFFSVTLCHNIIYHHTIMNRLSLLCSVIIVQNLIQN